MKWIIFALISLMSFSLKSHYLNCGSEIFYLNDRGDGLVDLKENPKGNLNDPNIYTYKLTTDNNLLYFFTDEVAKKGFSFNKITSEGITYWNYKKNGIWGNSKIGLTCKFTEQTLNLPAHAN